MSHPLESYERIYIINLATRGDRRVEMAEQLRRIGLSLDSPQVQLFDAVRPADAGGFPSIGAHGCFMSHLGVLKDAHAASYNRILVLEDDLNFSDDFLQRAPSKIASTMNNDCAIFYGGHRIKEPPLAAAGCIEIASNVTLETCHFISIHGPAIKAAVHYFGAMLTRKAGDAAGGPMHVDGAYNWLRRSHPHLRTLAAFPELGYQRVSRTDIHALRWFDRLPGVRQMVALARRARNA